MAGFKRGGSVGSAGKPIKKARAKKRAASNDEDSPPRNTKKSKGEDNKPAPLAPELNEDDDGRPYISLKAGGIRRVTISEFKGVPLIDIREYYTNPAGELKPGNKGISLTIEQYTTLLTGAPLLEAALAKQNIKVARPDYDADWSAAQASKEDDAVEEDDEVEEEAVGKVDDEEDEE